MMNLTVVKFLGIISIISSIGFMFVLFFLNPIKKGRYSGSRKMVIVSALLICSVTFAWLAVWPILGILLGEPEFENIPISALPSELIKYDDWGINAFILSIIKAFQTYSL
ncbi:MAG: hypothetical protein LIO65_03740, partial [Odoribacter sp.]|nr:hypothetical protein [Odoribacter sp.]